MLTINNTLISIAATIKIGNEKKFLFKYVILIKVKITIKHIKFKKISTIITFESTKLYTGKVASNKPIARINTDIIFNIFLCSILNFKLDIYLHD